MSWTAAAAQRARALPKRLTSKWSKTHLGPLLVLVLIGLSLIGLAAFSPSQSGVYGDIVSRSASMTLREDVNQEPNVWVEPSSPTRLDRFDSISPLPGHNLKTISAILRGGEGTQIAAIHLSAGSRLSISVSPAKIDNPKTKTGWSLRILAGAPGSASLEIQAGAGATLSTEPAGLWAPGIVRISNQGASAVPMRLQATIVREKGDPASPDGPALLEDTPVSELRFGRENGRPENEGFTSAIVGGSLTVAGIFEKHKLQIGAPLALRGFTGVISRLSFEEDGMHIFFNGYAKRIELRPGEFVQNLTPSLLDVAYHTQWAKLLGSAGILIAGAWVTNAFAKEKN